MPRVVIVDTIEVLRSGAVRVKLSKQTVDNGEVVAAEPHRSPEMPIDFDFAAMREAVDAHLGSMGWPAPEPSEWERAEEHANLAWGRTAPAGSVELSLRNAAAKARDDALALAVAAPLQAAIAERDAALTGKDEELAAAAAREAALQAEIEALKDPTPKIVVVQD